MSVRTFTGSNTPPRTFGGLFKPSSSPSPWVRPPDWLPLPTVTETDQKFVGLHAVYPDANFVALSAAGDYTVDWGDGVVENFAANTVAQHEYNYDTYDVGGTTLCSRGYKQAVVTVTPQAGQSLSFLNLHQRHSALTVQYSSGFLDIALASASLTDLRIGVQTPGSSTQTIYMADLERVNIVRSDLRTLEQLFFSCFSLQSVASLATSTKTASTLSVAFTDTGDLVSAPGHGLRNGDTVTLTSVVGTTGLAVGARYFVVAETADTFQLSSAYGGAATAFTTDGLGVFVCGTSMNSMFYSCYSLTSVPLFDTAAVTNMSYMFGSCVSLTSVPLFNAAAVTNMGGMFNNCYALTSVPLFNTAAVTNMGSMFNNCRALTSVPLFNTAAVTNMVSMFSNCLSLTSAPMFDTASVTSMNSMFGSCYALTGVPLFDTSAVTNMNSMFYNCYSLTSVPLFDTAAVTNMSYMFGSCYALTGVPLFDTSAVTNMSYMFSNCRALASVPLFDTAAVTNMSSMFGSCSSLSKVSMTGTKISFSVANCKLSAARLNEIYSNLATVAGQTITVTGNYGTASDNPTIATAKGWTVTG